MFFIEGYCVVRCIEGNKRAKTKAPSKGAFMILRIIPGAGALTERLTISFDVAVIQALLIHKKYIIHYLVAVNNKPIVWRTIPRQPASLIPGTPT